jgi:hypothetical protein
MTTDGGVPAATHWLRLVAVLGYNLYSATLVGNPAPFVERLSRRIRDPQPGDLVLEVSTITRQLRADPFDACGLGILRRVADEPAFTKEEHDEEQAALAAAIPDEPYEPEPYDPPLERVQYIDRLDGSGEFRWHNAEFIAIPTDLANRWLGDPQPSGVVTRDSLLGDLADKGFRLRTTRGGSR